MDFVTFNYTSLLPRLYAEFGSEGQTIPDDAKFVYAFKTRQLVQIHSSLSRDPVCGVNDTSQIASNDLASNSDIANTYVKSEIQKLLGSKDDSDAASLLARADVLIIFGLSLGESDAQWWAAVVEQLKRNASLFVVIASLDVPTSRRIPTAYLRLSKKIKGRLLRFGGVSDKEADTLSERIFIPSRRFSSSKKHFLVFLESEAPYELSRETLLIIVRSIANEILVSPYQHGETREQLNKKGI